ncbi:MAG: response regulator [Candidatus Paceibacterota bacterium]|jgi:CheY-like chemotaxis protein
MDQKTILVVEDHIPVRLALVEKLTKHGYRAIEAKDGEEGLEVAGAQKPDLILLDLIMPRLGGMEMLEKLRKESEFGKKVPVIILTNLNPNDKIMKEVVETEPTFYLVKADWKLEDVIEKVNETLNPRI